MNDFKFTRNDLENAMFRATDWGNIPFSMQKFMILQYIESLKVVSEPTERMYSEKDMQAAYNAGIRDTVYFLEPTDFNQFIQSLNTPKP